MEGWQKGADAVLKLSGAGKERYFQNFPDRKEWFQANYPEHFGRSVAAATTSLKKVTKAKQQKQRLAAIRQAAQKRDQSAVLSPERRLMAQRRRESGEGLAGGMDTVADIRKSIAAGMPVRSGGIGSLFEQEKAKEGVYKEGNKWFFNGTEYPDQKSALNAQKGAADIAGLEQERSDYGSTFNSDFGKSLDKMKADKSTGVKTVSADGKKVWTGSGWISKDSFGALPPDRATNFKNPISGQGLDAPSVSGTDWPSSNPDWGANIGLEYPSMSISSETERALLQTPEAGAGSLKDRGARKAFSKTIAIRTNEEHSKEIEEETIEECMPMPGDNKWDYADEWKKNPIPKGGSSEAEDEPGEYDYEGDMAKSQLRSIMHNSKMLHDMLEDNTNLPEWVQSKLTLAEDYILTAANYMRGEMDRMDEEVEQIEEGTGAARKAKSDDLVKRSMLPSKSVIPAGKGFGDDLKKQKIMKKVGKALQKKRMALPTDNPSENELIPKSMLPDTPGYPEGYQMEEQVVEQTVEKPVEQQVETPVVEENTNPFVSAGSKFLTRTSARLVYGDKND